MQCYSTVKPAYKKPSFFQLFQKRYLLNIYSKEFSFHEIVLLLKLKGHEKTEIL